MLHPFIKYQATGNDFILFDNFKDSHFIYDRVLVASLCHRQRGIGADGIITLDQSDGYDFALHHYNADGSRGGGLCGNASRAVLHYAHSVGLISRHATFMAFDGAHSGFVENDLVYFKLRDVDHIEPLQNGYFVDNGTRHFVEIGDSVMDMANYHESFAKRYMPPFEKEGVNLNFVEIQDQAIVVRSCECGLEQEPLSCGTGSVASALVCAAYFGLKSPIEVRTKGGTLWVQFEASNGRCFKNIFLIGPVCQTFGGFVDLPLS